MLKVVVLVSGGGTNLQAILDGIDKGDITNTEIVGVISNNKDAFALVRAKSRAIPTACVSPQDYETRRLFSQSLLKTLAQFEPDLIVLAGFLVRLPQEVLGRYRHRVINVHPSLIPAFCGRGYYGLKIHEAALERGVKITGATVHFVDEGMDTGPIILQRTVDVQAYDTPQTLQRRVLEQAEWKILPEAIDLIANGKVRVEGNVARI